MEFQVEQKWLQEFYEAYCAYLKKLASVSDILQKVSQNKINVSPQTHLTQIFRLVNTIGKLFPSLNTAMNIVGRYHEFSFI